MIQVKAIHVEPKKSFLCKSEISPLATSTIVVIMPKKNQSHGCQFGPRHSTESFHALFFSFLSLSFFYFFFIHMTVDDPVDALILQLPDELQIKILGYLPPTERLRAAGVRIPI